MEVIERTVILPENHSFLIKEQELKNNKGVIHTHDKYELNLILDAYGRRFVAGNISKFVPGDLLFMAPGVPHCWEIDNKEMKPRAITIYFHKDFFEKAIINIPELALLHDLIKKSTHGLFIKTTDIEKLKQSFYELLQSESSFDNMIKILKLLKSLSNADNMYLLENTEYKWNIELHKNHRLRQVYEFVFYNFRTNIKLKDVASLISLSEGAFCVFFKKSTKISFTRFIKEVRVGYACKLLNEDMDKPVSQVCFESGYNNFANFNRQFKEITNFSPKEYRQRVR